ncbi:MAG: MASE1 domain-containing protein, partial [Elusimicrobia bacterium]|nr:MASE1 domain-containing protein [Elusimicrobiota bacterium]
MQKTLSASVGGKTPAVVIVALGYYVMARLGLLFVLGGTAASPIWPASGFGLAAVILFGSEAAAGIFLASWLGNAPSFAAPPHHAAAAAGVVALGSAAQALVGARLLRRFLAERRPLNRSRDVALFAMLTPLICLVSASVGTAASVAFGLTPRAIASSAWLTWWIGDVVGVLIVTPLALAWFPRAADENSEPARPADAARAAAALALVATSVLAGFDGPLRPESHYPLSFLPFPVLIWTSLNLGARGVTTAAALLAALVEWSALRGSGPFVAGWSTTESLLLSATYVAAAALTSFLLSALMSELRQSQAGLERRVSERDGDLWTANATLRVAALGRQQDGRRIQLYRHLVNELPVGIVVLRLEDPGDVRSLRIVEMNPAGLRMAASERPAAGESLLEFAPEAFDSELPRLCAEAVRTGKSAHIPDFVSRQRVPGAHFSIKVFPLGSPLVGLVI